MPEHKHTNRLIHETSPYLLQHAHNPVDWHAWGEEALRTARDENKPILLSIGYSACHWCHVMEHESFENEDIAALMNENFVNIKVDREERPDLDQIYMSAVQMMTGQGGWPMTMFLTPDGVPFYGGTYFPPEDRYNMPGFPRILLSVAEAYRAEPDQVMHTATSMLGELRRLGLAQASKDVIRTELLDDSYRRIAANYDERNGGFGGAPKFPPAMTLEFLLHTYYRTGRAEALDMVTHTCRKMANGGMYDQIGGGFHRYSVDQKWLVPHFEKMLYDNALLARLYLHVYQVTGDVFARTVAEHALDYVLREMTDSAGGFYSAQDADSEGHEGKFFVWTREEIVGHLGESAGPVFCDYYNITDGGNFEGRNILNVTDSIESVAPRNDLTVAALQTLLEESRAKLLAIRERRVKPARDEKVLTAWNALMLTAFAEGGAILGRGDYRETARNNGHFLLDQMIRDGLLLRTWKNGEAKLNAYLDDYAFLIDGLTVLYETTGEVDWLNSAVSLAGKMIDEFWDDDDGGFFYVGKSHEQLIVRTKDFFDNAIPSGNSVAAWSLLRLAVFTGEESYRRHALTTLGLFTDQIRRYPSAFGFSLSAIDFYLGSPREVALIGETSAALHDLLATVWRFYLPNRAIAVSATAVAPMTTIPLLSGRSPHQGLPTAFVCENYTCLAPVTDAASLAKLLQTPASAGSKAG